MMLKLTFITTLAILLLCVNSAISNEDEFFEFDQEFPRDETNQASKSDPIEKKPEKPVSSQTPQIKSSTGEADSSNSATNRPVQETNDDQKQDKLKEDLKLVDAPVFKTFRPESYYIEAAFTLACILYALNYFVGCSKNEKLARRWYDQWKESLRREFTLVGGAPYLATEGPQKKDMEESLSAFKGQKGLIKSTESVFYIWNSGRIGVDGLLIEMCLLKRQDLFSMALNLFKLENDTIYFRFLLSNAGYENFVFCLANKSLAPKLTQDFVDIGSFCSKRKPISQYSIDAPRLVVMSELNDVPTSLLDSSTAQFIYKHSKSIRYIHITDQFSTIREEVPTAQKLANPKRMATFSFAVPQSSTEGLIEELLFFSLEMLDRIRKFKLARDSKQKSEKNRQRITNLLQKTAFSQRQEAAQAKKEELRRQEKERIYNEDDPEKQRKWEKKEAKRELKKSQEGSSERQESYS